MARGKPHAIAEELIKPCAEKLVEIMIGSGAKKKIQQGSLSNDTIRSRIHDMAANVCQQVCSEIKQSALKASIQLNKSTNSASESHLTAFARYEKDRKVKEEFLFGNTLSATTTAADVKALVDSFFEANELSWQNFKHVCTDGAPAMIALKLKFATLVKNKWPHMTFSHCSLPIHSGIKNCISTFDRSYGRCSKKDQLHTFERKQPPALPTFSQRNESATYRTLVLYQSPWAIERHMPLLVV